MNVGVGHHGRHGDAEVGDIEAQLGALPEADLSLAVLLTPQARSSSATAFFEAPSLPFGLLRERDVALLVGGGSRRGIAVASREMWPTILPSWYWAVISFNARVAIGDAASMAVRRERWQRSDLPEPTIRRRFGSTMSRFRRSFVVGIRERLRAGKARRKGSISVNADFVLPVFRRSRKKPSVRLAVFPRPKVKARRAGIRAGGNEGGAAELGLAEQN